MGWIVGLAISPMSEQQNPRAEKAGEGRAAEDAELEFFLQYGLTGEGQETDEKAHGEY